MADRRLQVFETVARLLSFTRAAEALHMTQPAVTFQIRQLEEQFNTRLFDRTHNRVCLTEAGEIVYDYACRIAGIYEEMDGRIQELTGVTSGSLTLGASTTVAEYMLPALLGKFKARFADVNIRLKVANTEAIVGMVEKNVIDLGIVEGSVSNKQLLVEECLVDQLMMLCPVDHPLARRTSVSIEDILAYPFICREEGSGTREAIRDYVQREAGPEAELDICLELGSPEAIKGAVEAGMGISILSGSSVLKELKLQTLVAVPLSPVLERPFSFVRQRQKFRHRVAEELLCFAQAYCATANAH